MEATPGTSWHKALVPLVILLFSIETMVFGGFVMQARKKYAIPYPTMYAIPGTKRYYDESMKPAEEETKFSDTITDAEAFAFNSIQRGHQNTIENAPFFLGLLLVAWAYPLVAGIAGLFYLVGRALYMYGYTTNPNLRYYGAVFIYPSLLTLLGLTTRYMVSMVAPSPLETSMVYKVVQGANV
jgi:glutathione S-transferase